MPRQGDHSGITNNVRSIRSALGLSQQELARIAGVTRQSVNSIEAGRYVPNTRVALRLARALDCTVERLFNLEDSFEEQAVELASPVEGANRAVVARIGERLIAHPLATNRALQEGFACADASLRATDQGTVARMFVSSDRLERTAVLLGCDPSLSVLANQLAARGSDARLTWLPASSRQSLDAIQHGEAHVAGSHLRDPDGEQDNVSHARTALGTVGGLVIAFASWEQGLVTASGNPKEIHSIADLARPNVVLVNRARGAGTRQLLDELLEREGISHEQVRGYNREVESHLSVARSVASGLADVGVALRAAADVYGLGFIPIDEVRFDLVIPEPVFDHPAVVRMLDLLQSRSLREEVGSLPGYEVRQMGTVVARFPSAA
jgi:molybdate-binding protein/DNA-binding XRE family transcriptional regulator